jgi:spore maturation protein CgeB
MKILVIGKFYTEGFALHIAETLATMGHEVVRYAPGYKPIKGNGKVLHRFNQVFSTLYTLLDAIPFFRAWHNAALWPCVRDQKIDLIIACYDFLQPAELDAIKKHSNARIVMWYPDSMANFGRAYFMNTAYDALFFKDPYIVKTMKDVLPSPVYFLPECFLIMTLVICACISARLPRRVTSTPGGSPCSGTLPVSM